MRAAVATLLPALLLVTGCSQGVAPLERLIQITPPDVSVALIAPRADGVRNGLSLLTDLRRHHSQNADGLPLLAGAIDVCRAAATALTLDAADASLPVGVFLDLAPPGRAALALGYRQADPLAQALCTELAGLWGEVHVHAFPHERLLLVASSGELLRRMAIRAEACPCRARIPGEAPEDAASWIAIVRPARSAALWHARLSQWLSSGGTPASQEAAPPIDTALLAKLGLDPAELRAGVRGLGESSVGSEPIYGSLRANEGAYDLTLRWTATSHPGLDILLGPEPQAGLVPPLRAPSARIAAAVPLTEPVRELLLRGIEEWAMSTGDPVTRGAVAPVRGVLGDSIAFAALGESSGIVSVHVLDAAAAAGILRNLLPPPQFVDGGVAWTTFGEYPVGYAVGSDRVLVAFGPDSRSAAAPAAGDEPLVERPTVAGEALRWAVEADAQTLSWIASELGATLPRVLVDGDASIAVSAGMDGPEGVVHVKIRTGMSAGTGQVETDPDAP